MSRVQSLLIVMMVAVAGAMVAADTYTYTYDKATDKWVKKNQSFSMVDIGVACFGGQCIDVDCNSCHASMGSNRLSADPAQLRTHVDVHFSKAELGLAESGRTTMGGLLLTRSNGRLVIQAPGGARYQFHTGSRIIQGKNRQPLFVVSPGSRPPQLVK